MKTFNQFKSFLKDNHMYEEFCNLLDLYNEMFSTTYQEETFFTFYYEFTFKTLLIAIRDDYETSYKISTIDDMFQGFINDYEVYVVEPKRVIVASLRHENNQDAIDIFVQKFSNYKFEKTNLYIIAYKNETDIKRVV